MKAVQLGIVAAWLDEFYGESGSGVRSCVVSARIVERDHKGAS